MKPMNRIEQNRLESKQAPSKPDCLKTVVLIPLDGRPVCYDLPLLMAKMAGIQLLCPPRQLLGGADGVIKSPANLKALMAWLSKNLEKSELANNLNESVSLIIAVDTLLYGGLIPSRLGNESLESLREMLEAFYQKIRRLRNPVDKRFAFSSIMRIPSYNLDEEEPAYWQHHGRTLYQLSSEWHQAFPQNTVYDEQDNLYTHLLAWIQHSKQWESEEIYLDSAEFNKLILLDFLKRRERNFKLNQTLISDLHQNGWDYLVFCQDDTGPFGLNVYEAQCLRALLQNELLKKDGVPAKGHIQTGADEVACGMLTRWGMSQHESPLTVWPVFSHPALGPRIMARFDGMPIGEMVGQHIRSIGAKFASDIDSADLLLMVHTPANMQGDHCEEILADTEPSQTQTILDWYRRCLKTNQPFALVDLAYANGGDPDCIQSILEKEPDFFQHVYGYAGWNTPGNATGTALSMACLRLMAERANTFNQTTFQQLMMTRLLDDYAYQSLVRKAVRALPVSEQVEEMRLNALMAPYLTQIKQAVLGQESHSGFDNIQFRYPCNRTFEVAVLMEERHFEEFPDLSADKVLPGNIPQ